MSRYRVELCPIIPPCKGCTKRHYCCWGECEEYKSYRIEVEKLNEARRNYMKCQFVEPYDRKKWRDK